MLHAVRQDSFLRQESLKVGLTEKKIALFGVLSSDQ